MIRRTPDEKRAWYQLLPRNSPMGWTPLAWLLYLPTFLIEPIERTQAGRAGAVYWTVTMLGLIAFLVSYFRGYWVSGDKLKRVVAFQVGLAIGFSFINTGAGVLFIYAAAFAGQLDRSREALRTIIGIAVIGAIVSLLIDAPGYFWISSTLIALLIGGINLHFSQLGKTQSRLLLAQEEVEHLAATAERERIARDLHDVLGHTLSLIVLKSELAARLAERDPARAAGEMRDVESVARKTLQDVREAIRGYRATLQDEIIRSSSMLKAASIDALIEVSDAPLPLAVEETLALSLREAVTNVVRHSAATTCEISLRVDANQAVLSVGDDGRGAQAPEGFGLRGMRERVELFGGRVEREGAGGMKLKITMPILPADASVAESVVENRARNLA